MHEDDIDETQGPVSALEINSDFSTHQLEQFLWIGVVIIDRLLPHSEQATQIAVSRADLICNAFRKRYGDSRQDDGG